MGPVLKILTIVGIVVLVLAIVIAAVISLAAGLYSISIAGHRVAAVAARVRRGRPAFTEQDARSRSLQFLRELGLPDADLDIEHRTACTVEITRSVHEHDDTPAPPLRLRFDLYSGEIDIVEAPWQRCWRCGYDLRGALHSTCPECGEETVAPPSSLAR